MHQNRAEAPGFRAGEEAPWFRRDDARDLRTLQAARIHLRGRGIGWRLSPVPLGVAKRLPTGRPATGALDVRDLTSATQTVTWQLAVPPGLSASATRGTLDLKPGETRVVQVTIVADAHTPSSLPMTWTLSPPSSEAVVVRASVAIRQVAVAGAVH